MTLRSRDFESRASASSATSAPQPPGRAVRCPERSPRASGSQCAAAAWAHDRIVSRRQQRAIACAVPTAIITVGGHMNDQQPPDATRQLAIELAQARPMRRGSLSERYMKCGQVSCRCQQDLEARHGPYFSLTRGAGGTTRSRYLSEAQAKLARVQIEAGQQFRKQVDA